MHNKTLSLILMQNSLFITHLPACNFEECDKKKKCAKKIAKKFLKKLLKL